MKIKVLNTRFPNDREYSRVITLKKSIPVPRIGANLVRQELYGLL